MTNQVTAQELLDATNQSVELLTRAILFGIVEPDVEINQDVQLGVARAMFREMFDLQGDFRFTNRLDRGLAWAARDDVDPAFGIFFGEQSLMLVNHEQWDTVHAGEGYKAYRARLGHIIDGIYDA